MPVKDIDLGQKRIEALMGKEIVISLGFLGQKAETQHQDAKGLTVVEVASIHEHGAPEANIPARSMIGGYYDEHEAEIVGDLKNATLAIIDGKVGIEQAFEAVAVVHAGGVQTRMVSPGIPPPLSPVTLEIRRKTGRGADDPMATLRVRGQLRASVTHKVEIKAA